MVPGRFSLAFAAVAAVAMVLGASPASAVIVNVTTIADNVGNDNLCSLREAVDATNTNMPQFGGNGGADGDCFHDTMAGLDIIRLDAGSTYALSGTISEDANAGGDLDIEAGGVGLLIEALPTMSAKAVIDQDAADRVIELESGVASLYDATVTGGNGAGVNPDGGAGILVGNTGILGVNRSLVTGNFVNGSDPTHEGGGGIRLTAGAFADVVDSTVSGNGATNVDLATPGEGGGIQNSGGTLLTIDRSTLNGNTAGGGGDAGEGGAIKGEVDTYNSTISGNTAGGGGIGRGGGIYVSGLDTELFGTTVYANSALGGGEGGNLWGAANGDIDISSTIVAAGVAQTGQENCHSTLAVNGHSLESPTDQCGLGAPANGNLAPVPAASLKLDPILASNAPGLTQTHRLLSGSVAVDAPDPVGTCGGLNGHDQREVARPDQIAMTPGAPGTGTVCDVGSYEQRQAPIPTITGTTPASPSSSTTPSVFGTFPAGFDLAQVRIFSNPSCTGSAIGSSSPAGFTGPGIGVIVPAGTTTNLYAQTASPDVVSFCSAPLAYTALAPASPPGAAPGISATGLRAAALKKCKKKKSKKARRKCRKRARKLPV